MLVKILITSPGCSFKKGQLIRIGDKQGENLIRQGIAKRAVPGEKRTIPARPPQRANMQPPRFICGCGFVAKDAEMLSVHVAGCD